MPGLHPPPFFPLGFFLEVSLFSASGGTYFVYGTPLAMLVLSSPTGQGSLSSIKLEIYLLFIIITLYYVPLLLLLLLA